MPKIKLNLFFMAIFVLGFAPILCFSNMTNYNIFGYLYPEFYDWSCPKVKEIVKFIVAKAVAKEARMAASLLRLQFHDCFVKVNFLIFFDTKDKIFFCKIRKYNFFLVKVRI